MGRLPYLQTAPKEMSRQIGSFLGLNKGLVIAENEFSDMKNMSSDRFPAICTRQNRGEVQKTLSSPHGLFYKNGLAYADGTGLYYKDKKIADVTDTDKTMVGLGAYLVVFPDKIMYNTSTEELTHLEVSWTQSAKATFAPLQEGSTMVKISCTGIGKPFNTFDAVTISGCTNESFNKSAVIQEKADDYIVIIGDLTKELTQEKGLKLERTVPNMDFVCESENRLWGCSSEKHEIYASKLGDAANWQAFEGISTDSYAVTVGSDGDFTGCISHLGYVLFFKGDAIHKVFGNKPSNYQVTTSAPMRGVREGCERTLCVVNETLMYLSRNDVCSYDGAQPESVSAALPDMGFQAGTAGQYNGKYYASLRDKTGAWGLYVYDLQKQLWHKEDSMHALFMAYGDGKLYCIDSDKRLFTMAGERKETISWSLETGDLLEGSMAHKHIKRLFFRLDMEAGAEANVWICCDNSPEWEKLYTYRAKGQRTYVVNVIPARCQSYRIRLEGFGKAALIAVGKVIGEGSELSGTI